MQGSSRRVSTRNTKLRMDEARGGIIKVMASAESHKNDSSAGLRRLRRNQSDSVAFERKKRSNCAPSDKEETGSIGTSPVKLRKTQSDLSNSPKTSVGNSLNIGGEEEAPTIGDGTEVAVVMEEEEEEEETETEEGMKSFVDKEMDQPDEKPKTVQAEEKEEEEIPALSQEEEKNQNLVSMSPVDIVEKKQNLVMDYRAMKPDPAATPHCKLSFLMISTILMQSPFNSNISDAVSDQLMRKKKKCFRAPASRTTESKASVSNHN
ncbi:hypothetical protein BHE74_00012027 [Ensete ventricosum]|nr:hypothetical protein BHE74_00012027 [Ensete ventricosum]